MISRRHMFPRTPAAPGWPLRSATWAHGFPLLARGACRARTFGEISGKAPVGSECWQEQQHAPRTTLLQLAWAAPFGTRAQARFLLSGGLYITARQFSFVPRMI